MSFAKEWCRKRFSTSGQYDPIWDAAFEEFMSQSKEWNWRTFIPKHRARYVIRQQRFF